MADIFIYFISFFISLPLVATIGIYGISKVAQGKPWKAVRHAVNGSLPLYLIAVPILLQMVTGNSFIGSIILLVLLTMAGLIVFQWKSNQDIRFFKALKILWKILFLLFLFAYLLLVPIGIIQRIFF